MTILEKAKEFSQNDFFNQNKYNIQKLKPGLPDSKVTLQRLVIITSV